MINTLRLTWVKGLEWFQALEPSQRLELHSFFYLSLPGGAAFAQAGRVIEYQRTQLILELQVTLPGSDITCRIGVVLPYQYLKLTGKYWRRHLWRKVTGTLGSDAGGALGIRTHHGPSE